MKRRRTLLLSFLLLLIVLGIPTGVVVSEYHHVQVHSALIAAVKANDTRAALAALHAGGEADFPRKHSTVRPVWIQWLDRMAGLKVESGDAEPSLLAQAVQHNDTILVKALLENGATDVQGLITNVVDMESPKEPIPLLSAAAEVGSLEICKALVAHGANVNQGEHNCPLIMAAQHGHSAVIRFLFQHGAQLDKLDGFGDDSLMVATRSGDIESVRLLLAHGANAHSEGRWGSALTDAVRGENLALVKLLVEVGADVNGGGAYTRVLQDAADVGDVEIVRYLLQKGASVNRNGKWNRTPLLEAVQEGHADVVKLLLEHGADWRPKAGAGGSTALHLAQSLRNREIVQMLKKVGAKE